MKLRLFSSKRDPASGPNLVSIQSPRFHLATVLVCPFRLGLTLTPARVSAEWAGQTYIVACDLARPIHHRVLQPVGELDEETSARIMKTFARLLAR